MGPLSGIRKSRQANLEVVFRGIPLDLAGLGNRVFASRILSSSRVGGVAPRSSKRIARKWYGIAMKLGILMGREIKQSEELKKVGAFMPDIPVDFRRLNGSELHPRRDARLTGATRSAGLARPSLLDNYAPG